MSQLEANPSGQKAFGTIRTRRSRGFLFTAATAILVLSLAIFWGLWKWLGPERPAPQAGDSPATTGARQRPALAYKPSATPLRTIGVETRAVLAEQVAQEPSRHVTVRIGAETAFSARAWDELAEPDETVRQKGLALLAAESPEDRALGGILLFFAKALTDEVIGALVEDPDLMVPLTVFDWVRDFGTEEDVEAFRQTLGSREVPNEELLALIQKSEDAFGGGRSALDMLLLGLDEEAIPETLAAIAVGDAVAYDVREQALFKLFEPETAEKGLAALEKLKEQAAGDGSTLPLEKWADIAETAAEEGDDCKIWDTQLRVVSFLCNSDDPLAARDLANYLEYGLRRDDPEFEPIIEEGTWELANEFLQSRTPLRDSLPPEEIDALDRIAVSLNRLTAYDPAFVPFETVEDDGDEDEEEDEEDTDEDEELAEEDEDDTDEDAEDEDEDEEDDSEDEEDEDEEDDSEDEEDEDEEDDSEDEDEDEEDDSEDEDDDDDDGAEDDDSEDEDTDDANANADA